MNRGRLRYWTFVLLTATTCLLAAIPIVASDLFRQPYSPLWTVIHRTMARWNYTYNPAGGGAPPVFPWWRDPADAQIYFRDATLTTADGLELKAWYVPTVEPSTATVLMAHGLLGDKWSMLRLVPWLHEAGYNILLLDLRGHGEPARRLHRPSHRTQDRSP